MGYDDNGVQIGYDDNGVQREQINHTLDLVKDICIFLPAKT